MLNGRLFNGKNDPYRFLKGKGFILVWKSEWERDLPRNWILNVIQRNYCCLRERIFWCWDREREKIRKNSKGFLFNFNLNLFSLSLYNLTLYLSKFKGKRYPHSKISQYQRVRKWWKLLLEEESRNNKWND